MVILTHNYREKTMLKFTKSAKASLNHQLRIYLPILVALVITGCGGSKTFNDYARAGDTVAVAGGWQQNFNRENISITIKQGVGPGSQIVATIPQGDAAIRGSINLYADPLSSIIVSRETGIEFTPFANTYQQTISSNFTSGDKDWYQTTVFVDLPANLGLGVHQVIVQNSQGQTFSSNVEIIDGTGSPSTFSAVNSTELSPEQIAGISRLPHFTVDFTGTTIPHAIELTLAHDPDSTAGGTGKAYAVNPIGYKKNLSWTDDGTQMKVILIPTTSTTPDNIRDYKFYVTGAVNNLIVSSIAAYDLNGDSVVNVQASTTASN